MRYLVDISHTTALFTAVEVPRDVVARRAFPASTLTGYDQAEDAIERARHEVVKYGVDNVTFEVSADRHAYLASDATGFLRAKGAGYVGEFEGLSNVWPKYALPTELTETT